VNDRPPGLLVHATRLGDPVAKAVAAEAGKTHELDVGRIVAMTQQPHQPAKGGGRNRVIEIVECIGSKGLVFAAGHRTFLSFTG
jgi:hypothetical protein